MVVTCQSKVFTTHFVSKNVSSHVHVVVAVVNYLFLYRRCTVVIRGFNPLVSVLCHLISMF